jgi:hypothetical protein
MCEVDDVTGSSPPRHVPYSARIGGPERRLSERRFEPVRPPPPGPRLAVGPRPGVTCGARGASVNGVCQSACRAGVMSGGVGAPIRTAPCGGHSPLRSSGGSVHHEIASCTAQFVVLHRSACSDATASGPMTTSWLDPVVARGSRGQRRSYRQSSAVGSARTSAPTSVAHRAEIGRTRARRERPHMRSHKRSENRRHTVLRTVADRQRRKRLGEVIHNHVEIFFHVRSVLPH